MGGPTKSGAELKVVIDSPAVFVYPHSRQKTPRAPSPQGTVVLTLPRNRTVKALYITLTGRCILPAYKFEGTSLGREEKVTVYGKDDLLPPGEETQLDAGEHRFQFTIAVPSNISIGQCGTTKTYAGELTHIAQAFVELVPLPGMFGSTTPTIVKSNERYVCVACMPNEPGDVPDPVNISIEHFSPSLGPMRVEFFSQNLTLAAPALLKLHLSGPPSNVSILSIKTHITQSFSIQYGCLPPGKRITLPTDRIAVTHVDLPSPSSVPVVGKGSAGRKEVKKGEEWTFEDLLRMPTCEDMKPSVMAANPTFAATHKLDVEVWFGVEGDSSQKVVRIEAPIHFLSCVCLEESLLLPVYSHIAPSTLIKKINYPGCLCMCDYGFQEVAHLYQQVARGSPVVVSGGGERVQVPIKAQRLDAQEGQQWVD
ncbi:hypothetical protein MNV49_002254 [Pseudohyphozyma bogoriensis]|nr:hypothetical protein MNV49_002254 [Pseudohyphozyma bogoriensis]